MLNTKFPDWPNYSKKEADLASKILQSNKVNYWTGTECKKFEEEFSNYLGANYAVALANGTIALDAALKSLEIGSGDEVIVTSRTFIASVSSIANSGAVPIFADICTNSQNITSTSIKKSITKRTKAIVCVHLAGYPCEMRNIMKIAKENNLYVIEDCAQAHGAKYRGKNVGTIGDVGCWSFCQDKILTTAGEGGMVTTNNKNLWKKIWSLKDHGKSYDAIHKKNNDGVFNWVHGTYGFNWRMTEIQAAIGRFQLKKLPSWNKKRNHNQNYIWKFCRKINGLRVPEFNSKNWKFFHPDNVHGAYKCYVFVETKKLKSGWNRDRILNEINSMGVPCYAGSCSEVYLEEACRNVRPKKSLNNAKELGDTSLMFLIHPNLLNKHMKLTCNAIGKVMKKAVI